MLDGRLFYLAQLKSTWLVQCHFESWEESTCNIRPAFDQRSHSHSNELRHLLNQTYKFWTGGGGGGRCIIKCQTHQKYFLNIGILVNFLNILLEYRYTCYRIFNILLEYRYAWYQNFNILLEYRCKVCTISFERLEASP